MFIAQRNKPFEGPNQVVDIRTSIRRVTPYRKAKAKKNGIGVPNVGAMSEQRVHPFMNRDFVSFINKSFPPFVNKGFSPFISKGFALFINKGFTLLRDKRLLA